MSGDPTPAFVELMRRMRAECPWKAAQTHETLLPFLHEEAAELDEAIRAGDADAVRDELGDLLLQVVLHAVLAEEAGEFTFADVVAGIDAKMRRRNPHVVDPASLGRDAGSPPLSIDEVEAIYQEAKRRHG